MADHLAWSHSRLDKFRTCPKQLWHSIAPRGHPDRIEFVQTQAMKDGNEIDDALTKRISADVPLPLEFAAFEPLAQTMLQTPGNKFTQMKLALNASFEPCGYMDWNAAWVRVIYDIAVINGGYAFLGDWKNGQIRVDSNQLRLFAVVGFHYFPEVEVIDTSYIWLKHGITSDDTFERRYLADYWQTFIPDVERMQIAHKTGRFEPTPSKKACKWCDVNKAEKCPVAAVKYGKDQ